jgi:ribosome biogenesis protein YTM1
VRPFDFLVDGELLRLSLHKHLLAKQISAETVLRVEYVPAVLPPEPKEQHPHDDWVSAVAGCSGGGDGAEPLLASGSYDGMVRLWRRGGCVASWAAHRGPVQAVAAAASTRGDGPLLLTAGNDGTARLWRGMAAAADSGAAPAAVAQLKGHTDTVQAAAAAPDGALFVTGGWDSRLLLWRCGDALLEAAEAAAEAGGGVDAAAGGARKKQRAASGAAVPQLEEAPQGELKGHSQCVSGLAWPAEGARQLVAPHESGRISLGSIASCLPPAGVTPSSLHPPPLAPAGTLVSASWDHSVRLWDVASGTERDVLHHNKAVYCVAAAPGGAGLVAFGGAERALRLWDPRARTGEGLALRACASHAGWISALAWHPVSGAALPQMGVRHREAYA